MRYFKLKALSCTGKAGKVFFKKGDKTYREDEFLNADELVKNGHLEEVNTIQKGEQLGLSSKIEGDNSDVLFSISTDDGLKEIFSIDDLSKKKIVELLKHSEIEFSQQDSKEILFDLLLSNYDKED